jgi:hypothetical protein
MSKDAFEALNRLSGKASAADKQEKPSRRAKKTLMSWHDPMVVKQMKLIAFEQDKTQQALIQEALNLLFAKYGKDQIA